MQQSNLGFDLFSCGCVCVRRWTPHMVLTITSVKHAVPLYVLTQLFPILWCNKIYRVILMHYAYRFNNVSLSNDLRAFMIIPLLFGTSLEMWLVCSAQDSLLSISTPGNFALEIFLISPLFICMLGHSWFFPVSLNTIKLVLPTLRNSLFALTQFTTLLNFVFITFASRVKFRELWNKVVSSTNRIAEKKRILMKDHWYTPKIKVDPIWTLEVHRI